LFVCLFWCGGIQIPWLAGRKNGLVQLEGYQRKELIPRVE
jgi:hypothetical protein